MKKILFITFFPILFGCMSPDIKDKVDFFHMFNITSITISDSEELIGSYYENSTAMYNEEMGYIILNFPVSGARLNKVKEFYKPKQQGLLVERIDLIQKFKVNRTSTEIILKPDETYFLVEGENSQGLENYLNSEINDRILNEKRGLFNKLVKTTEQLPYIYIEKEIKLDIKKSNFSYNIFSEELNMNLEYISQYKHIKPQE